MGGPSVFDLPLGSVRGVSQPVQRFFGRAKQAFDLCAEKAGGVGLRVRVKRLDYFGK